MTTFLGLFCAAIGACLGAGGGWLLAKGRNFPGWLGRGLTPGDNARLARAPSSYFRAMGSTVLLAGVAAFLIGALLLVAFRVTVSPISLVVVLAICALLLAALTASLLWLLILAGRYRLFRWDKP